MAQRCTNQEIDKNSLLFDAVEVSDVKTMMQLVKSVDGFEPDTLTIALELAQDKGDAAMIKIIERAMKNKDIKMSELCSAVARGDHVGVETAIREGADPDMCMPWEFDKWGNTERAPILTVASHMGYAEVVSVLLEAGVNIEAKGTFIATPLITAIAFQHTDIVETLVAHGADIKTKDSMRGCLPIHLAAGYDMLQTVQFLYSHGSSLETVNNQGCTPLHAAVRYGSKTTAEWLVREGVNTDTVDNKGNTPIDDAETSGHMELAGWLRARKVSRIAAAVAVQALSKKKNVVVLNYIEFLQTNISKREGANKDSRNLRLTFTNLGYDVNIHENLTALETEDVLKELQRNTSMESLILIILSHGVNKYHFSTSEGGIMDLENVQKKFTDTGCPQLRGKPKIVLSNFCRGQDIELQRDALAIVEVPHHMVTIHASVDKIMTLRHPRKGTIFINSLCKVVKKDQSINEMLDKLCMEMMESGGTTPMMETFAPLPNFKF